MKKAFLVEPWFRAAQLGEPVRNNVRANNMSKKDRRGGRDDEYWNATFEKDEEWAPRRSSKRRRARGPRDDAKLEQLCRQVERRLALTFGELEDPLLQDVMIERIEPGFGAELVVIVDLPDGRDVGETLSRLEALKGRFRSEVAEAIHRKRTPQLVFTVAQSDEEGE